jgi:hypothetical protein
VRNHVVAQKGEQLPSGTKWLTEYHLTIEAGKNLMFIPNIQANEFPID